jgi:hypothetical protein
MVRRLPLPSFRRFTQMLTPSCPPRVVGHHRGPSCTPPLMESRRPKSPCHLLASSVSPHPTHVAQWLPLMSEMPRVKIERHAGHRRALRSDRTHGMGWPTGFTAGLGQCNEAMGQFWLLLVLLIPFSEINYYINITEIH